jgi:hypothetical protein
MEIGIIAKNIVIIGAILGAAFLSQQPFFKSNSKNYFYSQGLKKDTAISKTGDWLKSNVFSKISGVGGEVLKNTPTIESAKKEIETQKNNLLQNSFDSTKKFIAEKALQVLGIKIENLQPVENQCKCQN